MKQLLRFILESTLNGHLVKLLYTTLIFFYIIMSILQAYLGPVLRSVKIINLLLSQISIKMNVTIKGKGRYRYHDKARYTILFGEHSVFVLKRGIANIHQLYFDPDTRPLTYYAKFSLIQSMRVEGDDLIFNYFDEGREYILTLVDMLQEEIYPDVKAYLQPYKCFLHDEDFNSYNEEIHKGIIHDFYFGGTQTLQPTPSLTPSRDSWPTKTKTS